MKYLIPDYLLDSAIRHYESLAQAYVPNGEIKAANAKRVSGKEIRKLKEITNKQRMQWKETSES